MLNLKFKSSNEVYKVEYHQVTPTIARVRGDFPHIEGGFTLSPENKKNVWDYTAYSTIYREGEGWCEFSSDGSVYVEPEVEEPEEVEEEQTEITMDDIVDAITELSEMVFELEEMIGG